MTEEKKKEKVYFLYAGSNEFFKLYFPQKTLEVFKQELKNIWWFNSKRSSQMVDTVFIDISITPSPLTFYRIREEEADRLREMKCVPDKFTYILYGINVGLGILKVEINRKANVLTISFLSKYLWFLSMLITLLKNAYKGVDRASIIGEGD